MNDYKELVADLKELSEEEKEFASNSGDIYCAERLALAADAIEQLVKERDAAVEDLTFSYKHGLSCFACKHDFAVDAAEYCIDCKFNSNFEWRGVQEVEHETD